MQNFLEPGFRYNNIDYTGARALHLDICDEVIDNRFANFNEFQPCGSIADTKNFTSFETLHPLLFLRKNK